MRFEISLQLETNWLCWLEHWRQQFHCNISSANHFLVLLCLPHPHCSNDRARNTFCNFKQRQARPRSFWPFSRLWNIRIPRCRCYHISQPMLIRYYSSSSCFRCSIPTPPRWEIVVYVSIATDFHCLKTPIRSRSAVRTGLADLDTRLDCLTFSVFTILTLLFNFYPLFGQSVWVDIKNSFNTPQVCAVSTQCSKYSTVASSWLSHNSN